MENEHEMAPERQSTDIDAAKVPVTDSRKALVKDWTGKMSEALTYWNGLKVFETMRKCQLIAKTGTSEKEWLDSDKFIVPIITRHINQEVGGLYAKNPTNVAKRRQRLLFSVWDGRKSTVDQALELYMKGDKTAAPLLMDIAAGQDYMRLADRVARTLEILWSYYLSEQEHDYKTQLKALVRRTKVNGVGYVKLGFQRQTGYSSEREGKIADGRSRLAELKRLLTEAQEGEFDAQAKEAEQLTTLIADLQAEPDLVLREGPVLSFPRSTKVVIDPKCQHLKSFVGCGWIAEYEDLTPEEVLSLYEVDIGAQFTEMVPQDGSKDKKYARLWHIQDKVKRQTLCVCEGYPDFIYGPAPPDVKLERFWNIFPLVFNECEDESNPYPLSDVWMARHTQDEYNRSRESLRQHRIANQPYYVASKGKLETEDKKKLSNHAPHEVIEIAGMGPETKIENLVQRGQNTPVDPALYDVEGHFQDMLRTVGSQEANIGPTSGATATESSIAENSRMSSRDDNVDDLDDLLTALARAGGQLCLLELSKETVTEIVGPGAAWPEFAQTREEIQKDLMLETEAGSSGRPNKAAELADLERASALVVQLPGVNPEPITKRVLSLLNVDPEEAYVEGLPSITALNQAMGKPPGQPTGDPATEPGAQGPQGANNAPQPMANEPGAQPAFPQAAPGNAPMVGA